MEGCTGWRYVAEEVAAAGLAPHVADPAELAGRRGRKRHAKTDRAGARFMREQLQEGRLPECRALLEAYHDLRADHTAWLQRIQAALFRQGAPRLGLDVTVYSSAGKRSPGHLSRQGPAVLRWCAYEAGKAHARASAPDHADYAQVRDRIDGKRAALSEARKIVRQAAHVLAGLGDGALAAC